MDELNGVQIVIDTGLPDTLIAIVSSPDLKMHFQDGRVVLGTRVKVLGYIVNLKKPERVSDARTSRSG